MSKPLEIKIYQTDLGYSILINNVVPRDELGFEISFTSLNETLCYLFYDLGRKQERKKRRSKCRLKYYSNKKPKEK